MTDTNDGYVVTSNNFSSFNPLSSLRAIYCYTGKKQIYDPYERPPFPIIIDTPTFRDVISSLQLGDFVMGGTVYGAGILWAYGISRPLPTLMQRLVVYHGVSHLFLFTSLVLMTTTSYRRLTGFWDNGLRWRKPEDKLRKYDNTSEFEKATVWKRLVVGSK